MNCIKYVGNAASLVLTMNDTSRIRVFIEKEGWRTEISEYVFWFFSPIS